MRFDVFDRAAREAFDRIPPEFRAGIDSLRVDARVQPHPTRDGVFTLGECVTEGYPSDWEGPDTTRSVVLLYHGSFRKLAEDDPAFDWEGELWETLTHEIRHHLEWLASDEGLEGVDYAMEQEFKRWDGDPFDPWYFQRGDPVAEGVYRVEKSFYLEQVWTPAEFEAATHLEFVWRGRHLEADRPADLGDVHFVEIVWSEEGSVDEGSGDGQSDEMLELVLLRKVGLWEGVRRLFGRGETVILESRTPARSS